MFDVGKRILINRNGAFGDSIHMSHLPRLLKDQGAVFVGVATGYKGKMILANNPFIDQIHYYEFGGIGLDPHFYDQRLRVIGLRYDRIIDLLHSLEVGALALEGQNVFFQHQKHREEMGSANYYDISTIKAGYPELCGKFKGEMFFTPKEIEIVEHDLLRKGRFRDNFKVMINIAGSSAHKHFIYAQDIAEWILKEYPDAVIFLTGDEVVAKTFEFKIDDPRVRSIITKKGFRQAALMMKYMNCALGAESGIMVAASMLGTPAIQLLTATSIYNHCKYAENDFSLQSPAWCSPCYKGPYKYYGCPKINHFPLCCYYNIEDIKNQIGKIYELFSATKKIATEMSVL